MSLIKDQCDYYAGLLLSEYKLLPRAKATIEIYVKQALGDMLASQLDPAFTLETAVGPQLDILGKYIGLSRNIGLPVPEPFYEFSDYTGVVGSPNGFTDYLNPAINAGVIWDNYLFQGTENTALSDAAYLFMLQMQIVLNSNDGTLASIMAFLQEFFPGQVLLLDNGNMSVTYYLGSNIPVPPAVLQPYLPVPMGVSVNFLNLDSVTGIPSTISASIASHTYPITATTAAVTGFASVGTAPFIYRWQWLSGDLNTQVLPGTPQVVATSPNAASTMFTYTRHASPPSQNPVTVTGVFQLVATDAHGIPFVSNPIAVTLTASLI